MLLFSVMEAACSCQVRMLRRPGSGEGGRGKEGIVVPMVSVEIKLVMSRSAWSIGAETIHG